MAEGKEEAAMKVQRIPTAATSIYCRAEWFPKTRVKLSRWLINFALRIGGIKFEDNGNPTRADKRRAQMKRG
jgi:hypothetical protein